MQRDWKYEKRKNKCEKGKKRFSGSNVVHSQVMLSLKYFARNVSPIYGRNDDITILDVSACNYVIIVRKNAIVVYTS